MNIQCDIILSILSGQMLLTTKLQELQVSLSGSVCYNDFVIKWVECSLMNILIHHILCYHVQCIILYYYICTAAVAQWVRALASQAEGCVF